MVYSEQHGSVLIIPRERNLTRFYIEIKNKEQSVDEKFVMDQARKIMAPYQVEWLLVEWFGDYRPMLHSGLRLGSLMRRECKPLIMPSIRGFSSQVTQHIHISLRPRRG